MINHNEYPGNENMFEDSNTSNSIESSDNSNNNGDDENKSSQNADKKKPKENLSRAPKIKDIHSDDYQEQPDTFDDDFELAGTHLKLEKTEQKTERKKLDTDTAKIIQDEKSKETTKIYPDVSQLSSAKKLKSKTGEKPGIVDGEKPTLDSAKVEKFKDTQKLLISDVEKRSFETFETDATEKVKPKTQVSIEKSTEVVNKNLIEDLNTIHTDSEIISRKQELKQLTENVGKFKIDLNPIEEIYFSTDRLTEDLSKQPLTNEEFQGRMYSDRTSSMTVRHDDVTKVSKNDKFETADVGVIRFEDESMEITDSDLQEELMSRYGDLEFSEYDLLQLKHIMLWEKFKALQKKNKKILSAIKRAKSFQQQMMPEPPKMLDSFECEALYKPADQISGDFYDYIPLKNGNYGFTIGDSAGHGIGPALIMSITKKLLLVFLTEGYSVQEAMIKTNMYVMQNIPSATFITAIAGEIDPFKKTFSFVRAGHPSLILYNPQKRGPNPILRMPNGMALGMDSGKVFNATLKIETIDLIPGDMLILVTDGVFEISNKKNERFGMTRFMELIMDFGNGTVPYLIRKINSTLQQFRAGSMQDDDLTVMCLKYLSADSADTRLREISSRIKLR